jgi:hypothetical protein
MRQFIDFKKAYDSMRRELLYNILIEFGIPMKLVRLIKMCLNETYGKVHIGNYFSDSFHIQNGLTQGDALSPLLFNFALEYALRKAQENQVGLKLNGTHQLLAYADDVDVLGDDIDTMKKNTETLIVARKEVCLKINVEKFSKSLGKRPLGRRRRRWVCNIKMDFGAKGLCDVDWIGLAQDRESWRALLNFQVF